MLSLLQSPSCSACSWVNQWIQNEVLGAGKDFIQELADWKEERLVPQNNHLGGVLGVRLFYESEMGGRWGNKVKDV